MPSMQPCHSNPPLFLFLFSAKQSSSRKDLLLNFQRAPSSLCPTSCIDTPSAGFLFCCLPKKIFTTQFLYLFPFSLVWFFFFCNFGKLFSITVLAGLVEGVFLMKSLGLHFGLCSAMADLGDVVIRSHHPPVCWTCMFRPGEVLKDNSTEEREYTTDARALCLLVQVPLDCYSVSQSHRGHLGLRPE